MIAHWPPVNERSPGMGNMRLVRLPVNIYKAAASYFSCYTWFKLQINISNTLTGPFKNPKDGERCRNTATNNVVIMKNLSKLVDKIYTSAERHIYLVTGSCNCWMSSGGFRHFAICCSLAVFRPSSTSLYFAVLSYKKTRSHPAGDEIPPFRPCGNDNYTNTSNSHIKISLRRFMRQIMMWNVCDETPRCSAEVTFTL